MEEKTQRPNARLQPGKLRYLRTPYPTKNKRCTMRNTKVSIDRTKPSCTDSRKEKNPSACTHPRTLICQTPLSDQDLTTYIGRATWEARQTALLTWHNLLRYIKDRRAAICPRNWEGSDWWTRLAVRKSESKLPISLRAYIQVYLSSIQHENLSLIGLLSISLK